MSPGTCGLQAPSIAVTRISGDLVLVPEVQPAANTRQVENLSNKVSTLDKAVYLLHLGVGSIIVAEFFKPKIRSYSLF